MNTRKLGNKWSEIKIYNQEIAFFKLREKWLSDFIITLFSLKKQLSSLGIQ